jgi:hypothetical protein
VSVTAGYPHAVGLMRMTAAAPLAELSVWSGAAIDVGVAGLILYRPTSKLGLIAALAVSIFYIIAGSLLLPALWADPLGPMMKIWPILAFNLLCLAILDER